MAESINKSERVSRGGFVKGIKAEFKRITWPTKNEMKKSFLAVVTISIIFLALVAMLDGGFSRFFHLLLNFK